MTPVFAIGERVIVRAWWNWGATGTVATIVPGYPEGLTVHVDLDRPVEDQTRAAFSPFALDKLEATS